MVTVIVQHEVKDFPAWKKVFDEDEPGRAKAGVKPAGLYTSAKNRNDVTMIFEAPDAELFAKMMSDPKRQAEIESAGVVGSISASILNRV